ncbi:hypothetical protein F6R98_04525 [Candidatus Methylospira mobilis]|uniref:Uncharacterized protein n=1 Tax=Candidatus Methylospira mobilis TaxID=1808979 RepID=A0A5Q0BJK4_9GAMM|nr:hypothetical protein [Candidatus Methylospira mobilis]QFY41986.1 hypothetical protein F6R98_04525 [Candidatus Methylospira mobilis]
MMTVNELSVENRIRAERLCRRIGDELAALHFALGEAASPSVDTLQFEAVNDPYSGEASHCGRWLGNGGYRIGEITLHADGSFYGEYDVVRPHPHKKNWFVEAIVVWGRGETIKAEARLQPAPDSA